MYGSSGGRGGVRAVAHAVYATATYVMYAKGAPKSRIEISEFFQKWGGGIRFQFVLHFSIQLLGPWVVLKDIIFQNRFTQSPD